MGLLGMLVREVITLVSEFNSKKKLEKDLGRKVEKRDIYSLGANLEAAERTNPPNPPFQTANPQFQTAPPPGFQAPQTLTPAVKPKSNLLIFAILGGGALLMLVFGVIVLFFMMMPQSTYDRLNPFTPKPVAGTFPATIGEYKLKDEVQYLGTYQDICKCNYFLSSYTKDAKYVTYKVLQYKTEADAKKYLAGKAFIGGKPRYEQETDSRFIEIDKERGFAVIALTAGTNLITITSDKPADAIAFENALPYAAFGVAQPPARSDAGLVDDALQVTDLLKEFKLDQKAAKAKYDGKILLLTGTVIVSNSENNGKPYLGFQLPGTKPTMDSMVLSEFSTSETSKVANTKANTVVRFKGKVNMSNLIPDLVTVEDCKFEPDK